ncbi:hypothetical protein RvY_02465 [Ramazzottius varieornatus]|uniref:Malonyl-CoA:ACP transacylase (MAT) domain-containing protein n=1 Tax=Ramazzottius varieornatus TaxID=947166 RepID=A0A1D1UKK7_RAMVA|nr:hypothetical protein RvY_02465 [Ramazzottius varieornatus]
MEKAPVKCHTSLQKVILEPKARTSRWLSSAFPEADWSTTEARLASADYFSHNLRSPVQFRHVAGNIPDKAVTIEVSPHGVLQQFMQQTISGASAQACSVSLMDHNSASALTHLYEVLGQLYVRGLHPDVKQLYPIPSLPAPRDTPFLGPAVQWDHSADWRTPHFSDFIHKRCSSAQNTIKVDLLDPLNHHYSQYKFAGQTVFPLGGLINLLANEFYKQSGCTKRKTEHCSDVHSVMCISYANPWASA